MSDEPLPRKRAIRREPLRRGARDSLERRYYPDLQQRVFAPLSRELAARLRAKSVVLDAGSGPGTWVLADAVHPAAGDGPQAQEGYGGLWVGVDACVPAARQVDEFVNGRLDSLPFADGCFDLVLAYNVLEHLPDPAAVLHELARVLKPGGYLCFKTPAANAPLFLLARLLPVRWHKRLKAAIGVDQEDVFATYYRINTLGQLRRELEGAGFRQEWLQTVDQTYAYTSHFAGAYALGLLYSRLTNSAALSFLRNQIVGIYRLAEAAP